MSGSPPAPLMVDASRDSVIARTLDALDRLPADPGWVLVGGVAVFLRLGSVTRPTADGDTVARSQRALLDQLAGDPHVEVISGGKLIIGTGRGPARVDVMDLADDPPPADEQRRMFALARRTALATAIDTPVVLRGADLEMVLPLATTASLVALKTVSMVRRPHGGTPGKVGSDIHDLVRLVATGARRLAGELVAADVELSGWIRDSVQRAFDDDLRYTIQRLRLHDRSAGAVALADEEVGATVALADAIADQLGDR